jgi:hypothetical protein
MTINYINKGPRLWDEAARRNLGLRNENGVFVAEDEIGAQALIDTFDPVAAVVPLKVAAVKAEAQRRIFAIMPAWKQSNLMAQALNDIIDHGQDATARPADQKATKVAADAAWGKIKAIREASNVIEAKLLAMTKWQELEEHDATTDAIWPKQRLTHDLRR